MKTSVLMILALASVSAVAQTATLDRSFYREPDQGSWPGDALSEQQFLDAVAHFKPVNPCKSSPEWALIGPNNLLLKGSSYQIERHGSYINLMHGYWGGTTFLASDITIRGVEALAQRMLAEDCKYGGNPTLDNGTKKEKP